MRRLLLIVLCLCLFSLITSCDSPASTAVDLSPTTNTVSNTSSVTSTTESIELLDVFEDTTAVEESQQEEVQAQENKEKIVYITKTGEKYHSDGCRYLSKSQIEINLDDAISKGYSPCSKCSP
jgi:hypothetical protein